ncbi:prolyl oligopeptidase family serine peptidase [uncultured Streptococcus sp.]|uniref:prolyl oligopeptidase family serine peptidase n=1 Tax=uncultured Streptococcus sp. TaxID=83427 RepID=UPI0027DB758E|nr:prolyl oligopeptidase family serine peptidase [uncultured Streptococcus sp.]
MKKTWKTGFVLGLASCSLFLANQVRADDLAVAINQVNLGIKGYEFGPAVKHLIVSLDTPVDKVSKEQLKVTTAGVEQKVQSVYLSDAKGNKSKDSSSQFVTIELPVSFDVKANAGVATPFRYDLTDFHNHWVDDYTVSIAGLGVVSGDAQATLATEENGIANRVSTQTDAFSNRGSHSGVYLNPMTQQEEEITLQYAAYEPQKLADGEKNPLIIWLHGQGEGGDDTDITLLGNEVVALAQKSVQKHFLAGNQSGAYVLAVQTPTYWMDEGDGTNSGAGDSRYTQALMDTIKDYVDQHTDVDTSRIYLTGGSNGGYMTINMGVHYPDYFAALVPQAAAYSYYQYERNDDGTYKTQPDEKSLSGVSAIRKDDVYFGTDQINALKNQPMWFIHAKNDTVVNPKNYALPVYKALVDNGAKNKWFSYFESVKGSDMKNTNYLGHWSWTYFFNDKVTGVQNASAIKKAKGLKGFEASNKTHGGSASAKVDGETYHNVYDWMNAQVKK